MEEIISISHERGVNSDRLAEMATYSRAIKRKAVPLRGRSCPENSRKLRLPDFVTTAQDDVKLSALRTDRFYPRKCSWYSFLLEAEPKPGP